MALITPSLSSVSSFASISPQDFNFSVASGDQIARSNLVIIDNATGATVYDQTIESFQLKHPVAGSTLINGKEYKAHIRTGNINNQWSSFSEWIVFWVLATPTVTITNIDEGGIVYNSTVTFTSDYSQTDGELLQSFKYLLYDNNSNLIKTFPEQFADGSAPLTQEIAGLENSILYHINTKTLSIHGQEGSSGLIPFKPYYIAPHLSSALTAENLADQGAIKLSAQLVQIIGQVESGTIQYIDGDWIDLTSGKISFQSGFNIHSDFVLKWWGKDIPDDIVFLPIYSDYGYIELMKYGDRIHAFKHLNSSSIVSHYASNQLSIATGQEFMIYMRMMNGAIDLSLKEV